MIDLARIVADEKCGDFENKFDSAASVEGIGGMSIFLEDQESMTDMFNSVIYWAS